MLRLILSSVFLRCVYGAMNALARYCGGTGSSESLTSASTCMHQVLFTSRRLMFFFLNLYDGKWYETNDIIHRPLTHHEKNLLENCAACESQSHRQSCTTTQSCQHFAGRMRAMTATCEVSIIYKVSVA